MRPPSSALGLGERIPVGRSYSGLDCNRTIRQVTGSRCGVSLLTTQKPPTRLRRMAWPVVGVAVTVGAAFYIRAVDPSNGGYPFCPLKYVTGIDCPACGGLRCVYSLGNGDIGAALDQNLLAVIVLPMIALWAVFALLARWRGDDEFPPASGGSSASSTALASSAAVNRAAALRMFMIAMIAFTIVFTVLRNIPGVGYLPSGIG